MKLLSRFREQWIVLEEVEPGLDWVVEMLRVPHLRIILRTASGVANAGEMSHYLARGDWPWLLRKGRTIFLDGCVEV